MNVGSLAIIGILQSRKTMVSRSDWKRSNSALCSWKDQFGNDSLFCTVSRCGQLLAYLPDFGPSSSVSLFQLVQQVSLHPGEETLAECWVQARDYSIPTLCNACCKFIRMVSSKNDLTNVLLVWFMSILPI